MKPPANSRLTVIKKSSKRRWGAPVWLCLCSCGKEVEVPACSLGRVLSCGCMRDEATAKTGRANKKHGQSHGSKEYTAWRAMKTRCLRPSYKSRGIVVCSKWLKSFEAFFRSMGSAPTKGHSVDRIDNNLGYFPGNCRWATAVQQGSNRSNNVKLTYHGETKTATEWSRVLRIKKITIFKRIEKGFPVNKILYKGDLRAVTH